MAPSPATATTMPEVAVPTATIRRGPSKGSTTITERRIGTGDGTELGDHANAGTSDESDASTEGQSWRDSIVSVDPSLCGIYHPGEPGLSLGLFAPADGQWSMGLKCEDINTKELKTHFVKLGRGLSGDCKEYLGSAPGVSDLPGPEGIKKLCNSLNKLLQKHKLDQPPRPLEEDTDGIESEDSVTKTQGDDLSEGDLPGSEGEINQTSPEPQLGAETDAHDGDSTRPGNLHPTHSPVEEAAESNDHSSAPSTSQNSTNAAAEASTEPVDRASTLADLSRIEPEEDDSSTLITADDRRVIERVLRPREAFQRQLSETSSAPLPSFPSGMTIVLFLTAIYAVCHQMVESEDDRTSAVCRIEAFMEEISVTFLSFVVTQGVVSPISKHGQLCGM
ncbi:hypothetical protein FOZ62_019377 [Perkinsus olseni]|uniref:Uncharacterized protein n=1 Tax=Perkinsus olseni TaxID=32597 RepID=A0A7J6QA18_PEROL|nr:hypothetical protein FOZ62_019377 [Perkinsus olseni]